MWLAIKLWASHSRRRRLLIVAGALTVFNGALLTVILMVIFDTGPDLQETPQETPDIAAIVSIDAPLAARVDKELQAALARRASLAAMESGAPCTYCAGLNQAFDLFSGRAQSALSDIRALERQLGRDRQPHTEQDASPLIPRRRTAERAAGRAIMALRLLAEKAAQCRRENFCAATDATRETALREEPGGLDCNRDKASLQAARTRLDRLALAVMAKAETCRTQACPALECSAGRALEADLAVASQAVDVLRRYGATTAQDALITSGRALLHSIRPEFEQMERAFNKIELSINDGLTDPRDMAEAIDFLVRLDDAISRFIDRMDRPWGTGGPSPVGLGEGLWRLRLVALNVQTMLDDARVALNRAQGSQADAGRQDDLALRLLPRFVDTLLDIARLKAVLDLADRLVVAKTDQPGACALDGWREAAAHVSEARAGLSLCLARSVCGPVDEPTSSPALSSRSGVNSIPGLLTKLAALQLIDDSQRFDVSRAGGIARNDPTSNASQETGGVGLFASRSSFQTGEVIQVTAKMTDAACLAEGGTIALVRDTDHAMVRRYKLDGPPTAALLFEAPSPSGRYRIEAQAPAERGGGAVASVAVEIEPLPPGCSGFTGAWSSDFGDLHLVERDGEVTGTYRRLSGGRPGFLIGQRTGRAVTGVWLSELGAGGTRLVLSSSGRRFTGTWSHHLTRTAGTGVWNGACRAER